MKIFLVFLGFVSISSFSTECTEEQLNDAIAHHESKVAPYSDGEFEFNVQELELENEQGGQYFYNIVLNYEYSDGGYRLLEMIAKLEDSQCQSELRIVDEN